MVCINLAMCIHEDPVVVAAFSQGMNRVFREPRFGIAGRVRRVNPCIHTPGARLSLERWRLGPGGGGFGLAKLQVFFEPHFVLLSTLDS